MRRGRDWVNLAGAIKAILAGTVLVVGGSPVAGIPDPLDPLRLGLVSVTSLALISMMFLLMVRVSDPLVPHAVFGVLNTGLAAVGGDIAFLRAFAVLMFAAATLLFNRTLWPRIRIRTYFAARGRGITSSDPEQQRRLVMLVEQLMTRPVQACRADATLAQAAQLMWDNDCGCLPVIGGNGATNVVGVITDRDICMCGLFEGRPLGDIAVAKAMSRGVVPCRASDGLENAERIMREARVRRLPVIDDSGMLVGMITLADLAREAARERASAARDVTDAEVESTLAAICAPLHHEVEAYRPTRRVAASERSALGAPGQP